MQFITYESIIEETIQHKSWQIDPKRARRALRILTDNKTGTMVMCARWDELHQPVSDENLWIVRASRGGWYYVRPDEHTCTCPDYKNGHICKHHLAVYLYTQQIERTRAAVIEEVGARSLTRPKEEQILTDLGF